MERTSETTAAQALQAARHFLARWRDRQTTNGVDDLAQDAWVAALRKPPESTGQIRAWFRKFGRNAQPRSGNASCVFVPSELRFDQPSMRSVRRRRRGQHQCIMRPIESARLNDKGEAGLGHEARSVSVDDLGGANLQRLPHCRNALSAPRRATVVAVDVRHLGRACVHRVLHGALVDRIANAHIHRRSARSLHNV